MSVSPVPDVTVPRNRSTRSEIVVAVDVACSAPQPDPQVVATIALRLARLKADSAAAEHLASAQVAIQTHGLLAFFHAARQQLGFAPMIDVAPATVSPTLISACLPNPIAPGDFGQSRETWTDCLGNRLTQPLRIFRPTTLDEIRSIVQQARTEGCHVRAVGSGHSFTDVAVTPDFLVDTHGLNRPLTLEHEVLRPGVAAETLFETEAGIVVRDLNEALWDAGLGLQNMGGYDGQTIAGVISTSTHGSGLGFGPLASQVEAITLVAGDGKTYRIEPSDGIADPEAWATRHPEIELKQDDGWFKACQVGIGCIGVVYAVVLRVRERFYLEEQRTLSPWSRVRREIEAGQVLRDNAHYEVLVNPYPTNGDYTTLVTRRNPVPEPTAPPFERPQRNFFVELAARVPGANDLLLAVLDTFPQLTPCILDEAMGALARDYVDRSYNVFNIGAANDVPAYGSELSFPLDRALPAVDRILEICSRRQRLGQVYLTSPFSLRFVQASSAHLSMMFGADTGTVEFPLLQGTVGGPELLREIEEQMYAFGGRPHWGLLNFLDGANGLIAAMYPLLPAWLEVFHRLDPDGTFASPFTERCGFSPRSFRRS